MKQLTPQCRAAQAIFGHSWVHLGLDVDEALDDARRVFWPEAPFAEWDEVEEARKAGMPM